MRAAGDVAADVRGVVGLEPRRSGDVAGQDQVLEPGSEALELGFHALGHVHGRAVGDVAVGPQRVLPRRCPARVDEALLGHEHVRALGMPAGRCLRFAGRDLLGRATQVDGAGPATLLVGPRHRPGQRVVHLEGRRPVLVAEQAVPVAGGQPVPGDGGHLARCQVEENGPRRGQLGRWTSRPRRCGSRPPAPRGRPASASAMAWDPPAATGQPTACAAAMSTGQRMR